MSLSKSGHGPGVHVSLILACGRGGSHRNRVCEKASAIGVIFMKDSENQRRIAFRHGRFASIVLLFYACGGHDEKIFCLIFGKSAVYRIK